MDQIVKAIVDFTNWLWGPPLMIILAMYDNRKRKEHEGMTINPRGEEAQGASGTQRTHPSPWKQTGIH